MELKNLLIRKVQLFPNEVCFIDKNEETTFSQFFSYINLFRREFHRNSLFPGNRLLIVCKKDIPSIAAIYACLIDGIVFVPIDYKSPQKRIEFIINDVSPQLILCDSDTKLNLPERMVNLGQINILGKENLNMSDSSKLNLDRYLPLQKAVQEISEDSQAYILYTSGSTGTPKGVVVNRKSLLSFIQSAIERAKYNKDTVFLNFFQLHFDPMLMEILAPWIVGGKCIVYNGSIFINDLIKTLQNYKVTDFSCTPNIISQFVGPISIFSRLDWSFLKTIWFGGEVANIKDLKTFHLRAPHVILFNGYGPTETVIACSLHKLVTKDFDSDILSIGTPMRNVNFLLIDKEGEVITEDDVKGELLVGGRQLMDGYWGYLTSAKKNNFKILFDKKYYCTGDYVYRKDGQYYFVERINSMIKIRGFRIYPVEVENALNEIVNNSIVYLLDNQLCAAVETFSEDKNIVGKIKSHLKEKLQEYMIPTLYLFYKEFPRLNSGKIDVIAIKNSNHGN